MRRDRAQGIGAQVYAGDRGYDDGESHFFLAQQGLRSALKLNSYRTRKRDPNKEGWLALKEDPDYSVMPQTAQAGLRERYKVEQKFGEAKAFHGLRRCRYLGLARYRLQAYLTALALNLKRSVMPKTALVKLLYGLGFRQPPQRVLQAA